MKQVPEGFENEELGKCPHCGSDAHWHLNYTTGRDAGWAIMCSDCLIGTRHVYGSKEIRAQLWFWNRRVEN